MRTLIRPNEVFDRDSAQKSLGLTKSSLAREIRLGRLRCSKRGGRCLFLGKWLLEWIAAGEVRPRREGRAGEGDPAGRAASSGKGEVTG